MFSVAKTLTALFTDIANEIRVKLNNNKLIKADDIPDILENNFTDKLGQTILKTIKTITSEDSLGCSRIYSQTFSNCSLLTSINLPNCSTIEYNAFGNCISLTLVSLPNCIEIETSAFQNCQALTQLNLPNCKKIGYGAFFSCISLKEVQLNNCLEILSQAFMDCSSLQSFYLGGSSICLISTSMIFNKVPNIFVPSSLISEYQTNSFWSYFSSKILPIVSNEE